MRSRNQRKGMSNMDIIIINNKNIHPVIIFFFLVIITIIMIIIRVGAKAGAMVLSGWAKSDMMEGSLLGHHTPMVIRIVMMMMMAYQKSDDIHTTPNVSFIFSPN